MLPEEYEVVYDGGHSAAVTAGGGGGAQVTPTVLASGVPFMGAGAFTTSSVSPNSNEVIYIAFCVSFGNPPVESDVFSVAGCGLTWVKVVEFNINSTRHRMGIFRALGTASPGTITITESSAQVGSTECPYAVVQFANASTAGTNGSGATGTPASNGATGTSVGLTITGTPGANDATFALFAVTANGVSGVTGDSNWVNLATQTLADNYTAALWDWDVDADLSPTWTWTGSQVAGAAGFIVVAA